MTSTWKWNVKVRFFLNKRSFVHFSRSKGMGVTQLVIFCGRLKCINPKWLKITTNFVIEAVVSSSTSSQINFDCHSEEPPAPSPPHN